MKFGDKLRVYNNVYKICASNEQYTILQDDKNIKFALPTAKIADLIKKGIINNEGAVSFMKALKVGSQLSESSQRVGVTPKTVNQGMAKLPKTDGNEQNKGVPVGTIRQGADGQEYKKISANPSIWVHVTSGTAHHGPGEEEIGGVSPFHPNSTENMKIYHKAVNKVVLNTHPDDHEKLKKMIKDYIETRVKLKNLSQVYSTPHLDSSGKQQQRKIDQKTFNQVKKVRDDAHTALEKLSLAVKESRLKKKKEVRS